MSSNSTRLPIAIRAAPGRHVVSVSYLGLTREAPREQRTAGGRGVGWQDWYRYFPWEDRREPNDALAAQVTAPLLAWAEAAPDAMLRWQRRNRVTINFGIEGNTWNEDLVLQRYETLWEAGLVPEAGGSYGAGAARWRTTIAASWPPASLGCAARSNTGRWCSN